jgi:HlyD family secretion protein
MLPDIKKESGIRLAFAWHAPNAKRASVYLLVPLLVAAGCNQAPDASTSAKTTVPVIAEIHPERKSVERVVEQPGLVQAYEETQLFARVPGYVRLPLDGKGRIVHDIGRPIRGPVLDLKGKEIEPGEILAELAVPELVEETKLKIAKTKQAEAEVDQARKALASAQANIAKMEATVVESRALLEHWDSQYKRMAQAVKTGSVDAQIGNETLNQFKAAGAHVTAAEAGVLKANADRDKAEADVRAAAAFVDVAKADAARADAMLSYAKIRAPYDGVVTLRKVSNGDFVQPAAGKGDWLFTVARLDPVRVVVGVPEADAELVRENSKVKLMIRAAQAFPLEGTVTRTSWSLEPASRTLRTEIDIPNKDGKLRPGMFVVARITNPLPESWTVPTAALTKQEEAYVCFLIEGDKVVRTPVVVGRGNDQLIEVAKWQKPGPPPTWEDFTGNEKIAVPAAGLKDGQTIQRTDKAK